MHIHLEKFEGPMGLLLYLIRKEEMDIFDINIHQITRQYMDYIQWMKELDLEVAGEFVAMAATLIHIKSRMLLPQYNDDGEVVEEVDPRKELVQRLLEYQKFQEAAQKLYERPLVGREVWLRGRSEHYQPDDEGEVLIEEEEALFPLIAAYRSVMKRVKSKVHRVMKQGVSIAERVLEIRQRFVVGRRMVLRDVLDSDPPEIQQQGPRLLITFLSLLELAKLGFISVFQSEPFCDIHIDTKKTIETTIISKVEDYNSHSEQAVEELLDTTAHEHEISPEKAAQDELSILRTGDSDSDTEEDFTDAATDEEIEQEERLLAQQSVESGVDDLGPELSGAPSEPEATS